MELLDFSLSENEWRKVSPAKLAGFMGEKTTANQVGRILSKLSQNDERIVKKRDMCKTLYMLPLKKCFLNNI